MTVSPANTTPAGAKRPLRLFARAGTSPRSGEKCGDFQAGVSTGGRPLGAPATLPATGPAALATAAAGESERQQQRAEERGDLSGERVSFIAPLPGSGFDASRLVSDAAAER